MQAGLTDPLLVGVLLMMLQQDGYKCHVTDEPKVVELVHAIERDEGPRKALMGLRQLVGTVARCEAPHDRRLGL